MTQSTITQQLRGLIRLTRWKEYIPFVIPLTVLGALLAAHHNEAMLDWRLGAVVAANILAVAYAFMINDIEDAPDDARDPDRAARNPVTNGEIGILFGYNACRVVAAVTMILYAMGGLWVFAIGGATLLLSHLYSWRPVRLKAYPLTDIVSHSLMLSGLLLLAGYFTYHNAPGIVWFVAAGVQVVLSSWSDHCTLRGSLPAPRANRKRSSVTSKPLQPVGELAICAASAAVSSCHS